jgi:hypothetical protein
MANDPVTQAPADTSTTTTNHLYDNPDLGPLDFLAAVMHSEEVPIAYRIAAADALLPYVAPPIKPTVKPWYVNGIPGNEDVIVKIVVDGGGIDVEQQPAKIGERRYVTRLH